MLSLRRTSANVTRMERTIIIPKVTVIVVMQPYTSMRLTDFTLPKSFAEDAITPKLSARGNQRARITPNGKIVYKFFLIFLDNVYQLLQSYLR